MCIRDSDDERGRIQMESLRSTGVNLDHVQLRKGCPNQSAYIIVDRSTGERTVLWRRDDCLRIDPGEIADDQITGARLLHIDGHDTPAVAHAAAIARRHGIPVTVDVDTIYHGFDRVLPNVDYLVASSEFPGNWTGIRDPVSYTHLDVYKRQVLRSSDIRVIRRARTVRRRAKQSESQTSRSSELPHVFSY